MGYILALLWIGIGFFGSLFYIEWTDPGIAVGERKMTILYKRCIQIGGCAADCAVITYGPEVDTQPFLGSNEKECKLTDEKGHLINLYLSESKLAGCLDAVGASSCSSYTNLVDDSW